MQISIRTGLVWRLLTALVVGAFAGAGCSLGSQDAPSLTGPSEFALSVTMAATPDQLPRDGTSQSTVVVSVRDAQGRAVGGQRLGLGISGPVGTSVSQSEVTTGADGKATFTVTAPPQSGIGESSVVVQAVPVGTNSSNSAVRTVSIALLGFSNTSAPTPSFTVAPTAPETNQLVTFDASASKDEGVACGSLCNYFWNFDDGTTGNGMVVTHRFSTARAHSITLVVTDAAGLSTNSIQVVTITAVRAPTVAITNTPDPAFVNLPAVFTATATAATGHSIQQYEWDFGDGTTQITMVPTVAHTFSAIGKLVVTVRAVDDLGQGGLGAKTVTITYAVDPPIANFVIAPTAPKVGDTVTLNASASTVGTGATIVSYTWDFGAGAPATTNSSPAVTTSYPAAGTYIVTLTVADSLGRSANKTATLTIAP
jgi:PKD repeat protein